MDERKRKASVPYVPDPIPEPEPAAVPPKMFSLMDSLKAALACERPAAGHIDECPAVLADQSQWCASCRARAQRNEDAVDQQ